MKVALDTSVLVAGLIAAHPRHELARGWLAAAAGARVEAWVAAHALTETWAVLTRAPLAVPLDGATARTLILAFRGYTRVAATDERTWDLAVQRCADRGLRGGAVYDALHLAAAEVTGAEALVTLNVRDFERLRAVGSPRVLDPAVRPAP